MDRTSLKERLELYMKGVQTMVNEYWETNKFNFAPTVYKNLYKII